MGETPGGPRDTARAGAAIILPFKGAWPRFGRDVFVAPGAAVVGDVEIGDGSSIWFGAVLRGDDDAIRVGVDTNIQDGAVIHVFMDRYPTRIGDRVTIGHGARLHGCVIGDDSMIGISATVLDGVEVEPGAIVAAGATVAPGKRVRSGELWAGCPARLVRPVRDDERMFIARNSPHYRGLAAAYLATGVGKP